MLIGLLFLNPLIGAAVGAGAGALSGAVSDIGINDNFMKELSQSITPRSSVLFVLIRSATEDKVMEGIKAAGFHGTVLKHQLTVYCKSINCAKSYRVQLVREELQQQAKQEQAASTTSTTPPPLPNP